jgi:hypothetical protein
VILRSGICALMSRSSFARVFHFRVVAESTMQPRWEFVKFHGWAGCRKPLKTSRRRRLSSSAT